MPIASEDTFDFSQGSTSVMDALFQALNQGAGIQGQIETNPANQSQEDPFVTDLVNQIQSQIDQIVQSLHSTQNLGDFFG